MNKKERVFNRIMGKDVDYIPNINIIMQFSAKYLGIPYSVYCSDYRKLVEADIKTSEHFGIDLLCVVSDPMREVEMFGGEVIIPFDDVPYEGKHLIEKYSDISKLKEKNLFNCKRAYDRVQAVELFKKEAGDEYPVCGWVEGPIAEACDLRGISSFMMDIITEPEFSKELMEKCTENAIYYAKEQIKAGADMIGVGDAAASLIGPELYQELVYPYQERLLYEIRKAEVYTKLHICGNTQSILEYLPKQVIDIYDVDHLVDYKYAVDVLGEFCSVSGNFDPVEILLQGNSQS
ncbi:MAG: uroporphyrinogen decarboxylase family protein, partial [Clostridia bacterium]|nr:uroporphyrinogen decarboxylase family protein [Clostridia bacterium]